MKKNVKCNLLKSLFLTGTVLTVSACNKGDEKISKMDNELKSLKQEMEKKISEVEKTIEQSKKHEDKLIKNIDESIKKLETIKDANFFLDELNNIKNSLKQIDNEDDRKRIIKELKNNINFKIEKDFDDKVNFSCGKVLIENISSNCKNFGYYCKFAKGAMDLVGLEDKYKIDISYIEEWNDRYVKILRSFPKKYFAKKVFYFDVDTDKNIVAGWEKANKVKSLDIEKTIKNFIYICYFNSDFLDPEFNFQDVVLTNIENDYAFYFNCNVKFKGFEQRLNNIPIPSKYFDFNTLYFENGNFALKNPKGDTLKGIRGENLTDFFFISINKEKIKLKNRLTISLEASKICIKNTDNDKGQDFYFSKAYDNANEFSEKIEYLKMLKYYNLINIQPAVLTLGNELKIGNFDLLQFEFSTSDASNKFYIRNIYDNITALFELFDIEDCFVNLVEDGSGNEQIKLSQGGQNYFYELDSSINKLKFVIK